MGFVCSEVFRYLPCLADFIVALVVRGFVGSLPHAIAGSACVGVFYIPVNHWRIIKYNEWFSLSDMPPLSSHICPTQMITASTINRWDPIIWLETPSIRISFAIGTVLNWIMLIQNLNIRFRFPARWTGETITGQADDLPYWSGN